MLNDLFLLVIGLVIGWFFLPEPAWARAIVSKIPVIGQYVKKD